MSAIFLNGHFWHCLILCNRVFFKVAEDSVHLAPHGVPSNPIPRALSSSRLHDMAATDYGATYQQGQPTLDIPGGAPTNPFLSQAPQQPQYYEQNQYSTVR